MIKETIIHVLNNSGSHPTDTAVNGSTATSDPLLFLLLLLAVLIALSLACIYVYIRKKNVIATGENNYKQYNKQISAQAMVRLKRLSIVFIIAAVFVAIICGISGAQASIAYANTVANQVDVPKVASAEYNKEAGKLTINDYNMTNINQQNYVAFNKLSISALQDLDCEWTLLCNGKTLIDAKKADYTQDLADIIRIAPGQSIKFTINTNISEERAKAYIDKDILKISYGLDESRTPYIGNFSQNTGALAGTDDVGRHMPLDSQRYKKNDNLVGVFYFFFMGQHETSADTIRDNDKIVEAHPDAPLSDASWIAAGGGGNQATHYWGKPLFDYYTTSDTWVMRKQMQMFCDCGLDYLIFDCTNGFEYLDRVKELMGIMKEFDTQGYKVPQICFYTHGMRAEQQDTPMERVMNFYKSEETKDPSVSKFWFKYNGKPMIIGVANEATPAVKDYFEFKEAQWPIEPKKEKNSWPWIEFKNWLTPDSVYYDNAGKPMVMNISAGQHNDTVTFSFTAWYGGNDRSRSWVGDASTGYNSTDPADMNKGTNFQTQWDYLFNNNNKFGVKNVFVTAWNEWVAQRQPAREQHQDWPIVFWDCATPNCSRDIEPMDGKFGDNYYMQLVDNMRKFKGVEDRVNANNKITIDINGSFDQWDNPSITAQYQDAANDTVDRDCDSFAKVEHYTDKTGRNDIVKSKVTHDKNKLYYYVECADDISPATDENRMVLFLKTDANANNNTDGTWNGYSYAVNLHGQGVVSKCGGGWNWVDIEKVAVNISGRKMMLELPFNTLGLDSYKDGLVDLEFKWADNFQKNKNGEYKIFTFYKNGDAAPYGRMNYLYSNVARS